MLISDAIGKLGTETAFDVLARAAKLSAEGKDIINLGIGQPDFKTAPHIVEAAIKALRDGHHGYTPARGMPALTQAVADDIDQHRGVAVSPDNILIVPGGKVTMAFAMMLLGQPGRSILYPDPGFPIYRSMVAYTGAEPIPYSLPEDNGFSFSAEEILSKIRPDTSLIILNSPGNPTGGMAKPEEIEALVKGLEDHPDVVVMSDEIYSRLTLGDQPFVSLLGYESLRDRLIILDGWSKTYAMTGWRLGWGYWPDGLIDKAERLAINIHSCVNAPTQLAGVAALTGDQNPVETMRQAFIKRRDLVHAGLNALPGVSSILPQGAFYAFANVQETGISAAALQDGWLNEAGVATIAGTSFGTAGEGFVRLSFANSEANIARALERMGDWLGQRGN